MAEEATANISDAMSRARRSRSKARANASCKEQHKVKPSVARREGPLEHVPPAKRLKGAQ